MNINELKDFPPIDDNWSDEKKEEYQRLLVLNITSNRILNNIKQWANDPSILHKRDEYLRLYPKKDI